MFKMFAACDTCGMYEDCYVSFDDEDNVIYLCRKCFIERMKEIDDNGEQI